MIINFTERTKFSDNFPNLWRNLLTIFLLFLGIATGFLYYKFDNERKAYLADFFVDDKQVAGIKEKKDLALEIGGDIDFSKNQIVIPKLNVSSTPLDLSEFTASNILVKDKDSSTMLFAKNNYEKHSLASITKLMSGLVLLEQNLDLAVTTTVSIDDVSGVDIYAGDTFTLDELWRAAFVASSNKAILTLVDASGLSRENFVARMNEKAKELGMSDTSFVEPTGLDANNISTASDIVILLDEALDHEKIKDTLNLREVVLYSKERKKEIHMWNTDWLLLGWVPNNLSIIGGKTGFIDDSLYNFTVAIKNDEGHVIDIVILGATEHEFRFTEAKKIAEWVFANYTW
ncbi:MAG: hypothetical protein COY69_00735 [Candidatus Magasanikbacteria bacterium CG_4_10_14_0_8_um_filter_32_14]|uniref:Peptidase S11 D-alanyl-D-alanine carboxypeptidase A N-terminal domain-containing protein n=2 Tax=Candidatus Magasanikiibacteriota TaxID=1752731 RepID=A0A2M7RA24_9BACT|nr:MAG: hypothetical protein AUJ23_02670 [Candidatus Magasanikbacteria bacterium CG1_02_32_51]PIY93615.1 MAG: hypothetical protein COY69_00735 [Candidatus Magasanikbacteria bacterium CG_4_10_14_0_8_um_filter_32_14]